MCHIKTPLINWSVDVMALKTFGCVLIFNSALLREQTNPVGLFLRSLYDDLIRAAGFKFLISSALKEVDEIEVIMINTS